MRLLCSTVLVLASCAAAYSQGGAAVGMSEPDLRALVRDAVRFLDDKNNKTYEYSYLIRNQKKEFDSAGKLVSEESTVLHRGFQDGFTVTRVVERNGNPVSAEEKRKTDEQLAKKLAELKAMSQSEREAMKKKGRDEDSWAREVPEALRYKLAGEETISGRRCWVVDAEPNPSYRPKSMQARVFEKMRGKFWIDKADRELLRGEAETFDTVSIGFGLFARVEKGTRFAMQRLRLPDGNWVMESQRLRFGARVMLVKWVGNEVVTQFSDFRHKSQLAASR